MAEDSPLICYLVDEVLNVQPPQVREVLLNTSILEHVSGEVAIELTGDEQAAGILASLGRAPTRSCGRSGPGGTGITRCSPRCSA